MRLRRAETARRRIMSAPSVLLVARFSSLTFAFKPSQRAAQLSYFIRLTLRLFL